MTQMEAIAKKMGWGAGSYPQIGSLIQDDELTDTGEKALRERLNCDGFAVAFWSRGTVSVSCLEPEMDVLCSDLPTAFCKAYGLEWEKQ